MLTRRELGKLALAVPVAKVFGATSVFGRAAAPNSTIAGVQIGLIAPYSFGRDATDADTILKYVTEIGISGLELQNGPAERFAGAPAETGRGGGRGPGEPRAELTPEQQAARREAQAALKKWRLSASMDKFKELRKKYSDAGVRIYAFKLALSESMSDEEYQYTFNVAEALGANHITMELPTVSALTKRIGDFAAKRQMLVGYHTHTQGSLTVFDEALAQSKYNAINVDIGHYVAGTSESPIPLILKHHSRIREHPPEGPQEGRRPEHALGPGRHADQGRPAVDEEGEIHLAGDDRARYPVPEGSSRVAEIGKCLQYCKDALAANA